LFLDALNVLPERPASNLVLSIGVVFALYALHSTQLCEPLVPIPISFRNELALYALRLALSGHPNPPDAVLDAWQADSALLRTRSYCNVAPGTWAPRPSVEDATRLVELVARDAGATVRLTSDITRPLPRESSLLTVVNIDAIAALDARYAAAKRAIQLPPGVPQQEWSAFHANLSHVQADLGTSLAVKARQAADERAQQIEHDLSEQAAQPKRRRESRSGSSRKSGQQRQVVPATSSAFAPPPRTSARARKPKRHPDDDDDADTALMSPSFGVPPPPVLGTSAPSSSATPQNRQFPRDVRDFCEICKVPDDFVQFFIGCEECNAWFHGDCLQPRVTEADASAMSEWYCDRCAPRAISSAQQT
jgi:hypothetical protein